MSEAERIANGLTHEMRAAIMAHKPGTYRGEKGSGWQDPSSAKDFGSFCRVGRDLMNMGLIEWHPDPKDSRTKLTGYGLDVRSVLARKVL